MIKSTSLDSFRDLIAENINQLSAGVFVPVFEEHLADMETPVSVYSAILGNEYIKNSFIFESAEGVGQNARYSFIGFNPFITLEINEYKLNLQIHDKSFLTLLEPVNENDNPLNVIDFLLKTFKVINLPELPRLISGAVGYLGYDTIRLVESIPFEAEKDQNVPQGILGFFNSIIVFDNLRKTIMYLNAPFVKKDTNPEDAYNKASEQIDKIKDWISNRKKDVFKPEFHEVDWKSNMEKAEFEKIVKEAKEYIAAGDIFQVVLSQRFSTEFSGNPFNIYRVLRIVNPSPYLYFINFDNLNIIGSSPELLVRVENKQVSTRPIAGTRPRGKNSDEDLQYEKDLLADKKELAEHLMLVDLGRNDLGKVCTFGTVHVSRMMKIEHYSHVMHIVSDVCGVLRDGFSTVDALYAAFPAGTLSGAPKIRAMEIIDELEPTERAIYGGAIGYFDFSGNMDWCIAIRTIVMDGQKLTLQAGAGIVADSVPENEYQETMNKAQALKTAVEWAAENNKKTVKQ